ncbi:ribbon-helix-helix domain-containing protein [Microcoleus anatoxicus]|uniref:CopG-like ribbon-helix-helix domain-containing protein n=1 Tax=Microcoleus anatoxicus PTRS2 TaxID=2705321 RepID=A0ABU8YLS8_9CYAN
MPNLPAKNLKRVTSYVPPNAYNVLEDWAKEEDRTVSNLVSRIVSQAVDAYLTKKTTKDEPTSD